MTIDLIEVDVDVGARRLKRMRAPPELTEEQEAELDADWARYEAEAEAEAALSPEERKQKDLDFQKQMIIEHLERQSNTEYDAYPWSLTPAGIFIQLAPRSPRGASCKAYHCDKKILPGKYRVALRPGRDHWSGSADFYHVDCFEDIVQLSHPSIAKYVAPECITTLDCSYVLDTGAFRLVSRYVEAATTPGRDANAAAAAGQDKSHLATASQNDPQQNSASPVVNKKDKAGSQGPATSHAESIVPPLGRDKAESVNVQDKPGYTVDQVTFHEPEIGLEQRAGVQTSDQANASAETSYDGEPVASSQEAHNEEESDSGGQEPWDLYRDCLAPSLSEEGNGEIRRLSHILSLWRLYQRIANAKSDTHLNQFAKELKAELTKDDVDQIKSIASVCFQVVRSAQGFRRVYRT